MARKGERDYPKEEIEQDLKSEDRGSPEAYQKSDPEGSPQPTHTVDSWCGTILYLSIKF